MNLRRRKLRSFVTRNQRGQSTLEFLLLFILGFLVTGAILGRGGNRGGGIPATLSRAAPVLGKEIEKRIQTGPDWEVKGQVNWERAPRRQRNL